MSLGSSLLAGPSSTTCLNNRAEFVLIRRPVYSTTPSCFSLDAPKNPSTHFYATVQYNKARCCSTVSSLNLTFSLCGIQSGKFAAYTQTNKWKCSVMSPLKIAVIWYFTFPVLPQSKTLSRNKAITYTLADTSLLWCFPFCSPCHTWYFSPLLLIICSVLPSHGANTTQHSPVVLTVTVHASFSFLVTHSIIPALMLQGAVTCYAYTHTYKQCDSICYQFLSVLIAKSSWSLLPSHLCWAYYNGVKWCPLLFVTNGFSSIPESFCISVSSPPLSPSLGALFIQHISYSRCNSQF